MYSIINLTLTHSSLSNPQPIVGIAKAFTLFSITWLLNASNEENSVRYVGFPVKTFLSLNSTKTGFDLLIWPLLRS